jgi:hypothetical protein
VFTQACLLLLLLLLLLHLLVLEGRFRRPCLPA